MDIGEMIENGKDVHFTSWFNVIEKNDIDTVKKYIHKTKYNCVLIEYAITEDKHEIVDYLLSIMNTCPDCGRYNSCHPSLIRCPSTCQRLIHYSSHAKTFGAKKSAECIEKHKC